VTVPPEFGFDSTPATPAADNVFVGQRAGAGLDLQWQIWRFDVWVEALRVQFEPDNGLPASSFDGRGGYVQAGFFIVPSRLQAVLKYDTLDPNDEVEDDDQGTWTAGANLLFKNGRHQAPGPLPALRRPRGRDGVARPSCACR
jgi:hypothetical protein